MHLTVLIRLCIDASFGGEAGRRQGVMVYVSALDLCTPSPCPPNKVLSSELPCTQYEDPQEPVATEAVVKQMRGNHAMFTRNRKQMYPLYWRELARKDPRRGQWMDRMAELGVLETPMEAPSL